MSRTLRSPLLSTAVAAAAGLGAIAPALAEAPAADARAAERVLVEACAAPAWVGIHAAEALLAVGRPEPVLDAFRPRAATEEPKVRVGVWRVLARAEPDGAKRGEYVARIRAALLDARGPDRLHALEALAKLDEPAADAAERDVVRAMADDAAVAPFALWRLALDGDRRTIERRLVIDRLIRCLRGNDAVGRARAAYVLGRLPDAGDAAAAALRSALAREPKDSPAFTPLSVAVGGDAARALLADASPAARYSGAMWVADHGAAADRAAVERLLADADQDVRVAAAFATIRLNAAAASTRPTE